MLWEVCLVFWILGGLIWLIGRIIEVKFIRGIGCVGLVLFGVPSLFYIVGSAYDAYYTSIPANNFRDVFHLSPPPDVSDLQSRVGGYWDGSSCYIKFRVPPKTFLSLAGAEWRKGTNKDDAREQVRQLTDDGPAWWKPEVNARTLIYLPAKPAHAFAGEFNAQVYDPSTRTAYFGYVGID